MSSPVLSFIAVILVVLFLGYCFHRLMIWLEDHGLIYYRKSGRGSGVGNALHELQSFFEPEARISKIEIQAEREEERKAGDDGGNPDALEETDLTKPHKD